VSLSTPGWARDRHFPGAAPTLPRYVSARRPGAGAGAGAGAGEVDARAADPIVEAEVERVARAVVSDLLHEPTLGLRRAGERGSSAVYAQTVRELFGLSA
jgi:hypothetical protein